MLPRSGRGRQNPFYVLESRESAAMWQSWPDLFPGWDFSPLSFFNTWQRGEIDVVWLVSYGFALEVFLVH